MRIVILRLVALYVMVMGLATGIHVILTPWLYADAESAPTAWVIMNPMNVAAAVLILVLSVVRKIQYDRSRREEGAIESTVQHIDVNVPVYVAAILSILYPLNTIHEAVSPGESILSIWYYLDAALAVLGTAVGIRILRGTGLRIFYD